MGCNKASNKGCNMMSNNDSNIGCNKGVNKRVNIASNNDVNKVVNITYDNLGFPIPCVFWSEVKIGSKLIINFKDLIHFEESYINGNLYRLYDCIVLHDFVNNGISLSKNSYFKLNIPEQSFMRAFQKYSNRDFLNYIKDGVVIHLTRESKKKIIIDNIERYVKGNDYDPDIFN